MTRRFGVLAIVLGVLACAAPAPAAVSLLQVGSFAQPVYVTAPPGDAQRVFVVQKGGKIVMVKDGAPSVFLDLTGKVRSTGGEQGLLSMAFAPDYATSGEFYVYYTAPPASGGGSGSDLTIEAYRRADADHGDPGSARPLVVIPHRINDNHNGGQLQIGPDGMLWAGTGDGGGGNDTLGNGQQTDPSWNDPAAGHDARLGKLLRIDPRTGAAAAGNPGFGQGEIWAYGLRNPWRFSFDRATGDLVIGDVGQDTWEEVDLAPAAAGLGKGNNYGWNVYEGAHPRGSTAPAGSPPGIAMPVLEKAHAAPDSFSSIAGGYVVRDPALPDLLGRYVYADTYRGDLRAVTLGAGGATGDTATGLHVSTLASFGEDACGRVYAVSLEGPVYRLAQTGACAPPSGPSPGPAPTPTAPGTTTAAPKLTLRAAAKQRPWKTGVVRFTASCDTTCSLSARGTFLVTRTKSGAGAARVRLLHTATARTKLAAGARVSVKVKVPATTRRSLLRALKRDRRVTLRFAVAATGANGKKTTSTARSRITRR